ncbi:MAG TPA: hypothetical protein V6C97_26865 [Oculatellaceae cyanobacterium]
MEKPASGKLYEQAANQNKEADSHAHKIIDEISAWFKCSIQANQTNTAALQENMHENLSAASDGFKNACQSASEGLHAFGSELKRENPEWAKFAEQASHAPGKAVHRIADFYKTRPTIAAIETVIPPVVIVDALVRGGLHERRPKPIGATAEEIRQRPE